MFIRRVSPAETKTYAFCRNIAAIAAIGAILFWFGVAISTAQNEFDTKIRSERCPVIGPLINNVQVLMKGVDEFKPIEGLGINVTAASRSGRTEKVCVSRTLPAFNDFIEVSGGLTLVNHSWFAVFNCTDSDTGSTVFPITAMRAVPLPVNDTTMAAGTITPKLRPIYSSFKTSITFDPNALGDSDLNMCDYIQDYRSGTIFDVLSSVGGLFALLQVWYLIMFGRPILWGLTGAKLITPFGLFGSCCSQRFKRRLRKQYHSTSPSRQPEIRVDAFLRDFVVDFGPISIEEDTSMTVGRAVPRTGVLKKLKQTAQELLQLGWGGAGRSKHKKSRNKAEKVWVTNDLELAVRSTNLNATSTGMDGHRLGGEWLEIGQRLNRGMGVAV
ncbi:hypothetical protein FRC07_008364 [Ceratobasidium sp. 392]|nr:hypothetical protein FRC07_008364 [Ceratobasidium sp. 392]